MLANKHWGSTNSSTLSPLKENHRQTSSRVAILTDIFADHCLVLACVSHLTSLISDSFLVSSTLRKIGDTCKKPLNYNYASEIYILMKKRENTCIVVRAEHSLEIIMMMN